MNKKIAKFTWLHNGNYGSTLQAAALQIYLRNCGFDVVDVDYRASLKTKLKNWAENKNSPKLFLGKFTEARMRKTYPHPELLAAREQKFDEFRKQTLQLTPRYCSPKEVAAAMKEYEIFLCGSDQIWSPALMNPVYFLTCVPEHGVKIAYAPSFGVSDTTGRKKKQMAEYLRSFSYLSVREKRGAELIAEMTGKQVPVLADPVMLLTAEEWETYMVPVKVPEKYIFCYLLTPNQAYVQAVRNYAERKGLPVLLVPTLKGPFGSGFEEHMEAGPAEWLGYLKGAEMVFTDSYHCCIFSAVFEKEFVLFKRFQDHSGFSENSRIYTLTEMLGTQGRLIDKTKLEKLDRLSETEPLDFADIKRRIASAAEESGAWICRILEKELSLENHD